MDRTRAKDINYQHQTAVPRVESVRKKEEGTTEEILKENSYGETPKDWYDMETTRHDCKVQTNWWRLHAPIEVETNA
mgnify:CR=1 FL=1